MKKLLTLFLTLGLLMPFVASAQVMTIGGGTGSTSPSGILYGDGTLHLKTVGIGANCTFTTGVFNCAGGSSVGNPFNFVSGTPNYLIGTTSPLGLILTASSTIGNGTQAGGLTISGGATTTLNAYFGSKVGIQNVSPAYALDVSGFINTDQYSGYKQAGNTILYASTTNNSLAVGNAAGTNFSTISADLSSVAVGYNVLHSASLTSAAQYNTGIGTQALQSVTTGNFNTATGWTALLFNTTGSNNTAYGVQALSNNTTGIDNVAVGANALINNNGNYNVGMGFNALAANGTGAQNMALGFYALAQNTTGSFNMALGAAAEQHNTSATSTVAVGQGAGYGLGGNYNNQGGTTVGYQSGYNFATGSDYNTLLGYQSGYNVTTGANNILIGAQTTTANENLTTGSNNIKLGYNNSFVSPTNNNQLNIQNILFGTNNSGTGGTYSTGTFGIGSSTPWARLAIQANNGDTNTTLFAIGSSTQGATTTLFSVSNTGNATLAGNLTFNDNVGASTMNINTAFTGSGFPTGTNLTVSAGNTVTSTGGGGTLTFQSGNGGVSTGSGGNIVFKSGSGGTSIGSILFQPGGSGNASVYSDTGSIWTFGNSPGTGGGPIQLKAGNATGAAGGIAYVTGGVGSATGNTAGGNVVIAAGAGGGSGAYGNTIINSAGGNVGIGTTVPLSALHVEGSFTSAGTYGAATISNQGISVVNTSGAGNRPYGVQFGGYPGYSFGGIYGVMLSSTNNTTGDIAIATRNAGTDTNFTERMRILSTGNVGIGTTSPYAQLSVATPPSLSSGTSASNRTLFAVASSTASATTTLFSVTNTGHIVASSTSPTLSACGTSPSMVGDDMHGTVTTGATANGCTVTFAQAYTIAPVCTVTSQTGSVVNTFSYAVTNTTLTTTETAIGGGKFDYHCIALTGN